MRAGATVPGLAVNVDGGLFSVGDGHYRQGEGEACGTAVEGAMDVTLVVELIKGGGPAWPRLETDEHLIVVGSSRPLEDAWRVSQVGMVTWLMELYGLDKMDAYQLLSQTSQSPLANVVDANYSAVTKVPKALFPVRPPTAGCTGSCVKPPRQRRTSADPRRAVPRRTGPTRARLLRRRAGARRPRRNGRCARRPARRSGLRAARPGRSRSRRTRRRRPRPRRAGRRQARS